MLLLLSSTLSGQASLTGYVRDDETLRGLSNVELTITGTDKHVRTDKQGKCNIRDLPVGAAQVHLRFVGFAPIDTIIHAR
jgi:hypothetical protein